jgi:UPF0755 protein
MSEHAAAPSRLRLAVLGGLALLVVIIAAFVLWYELNNNALGPAGAPEVVQVKAGESASALTSDLAAHKVIASTLAFRLADVIHGTPTILPGSYEFHQNMAYSEVKALLNGGPNVSTLSVVPGQTVREIANHVDALPGHGTESFDKVANSGAVHSKFSPAGSNDLEGMLGSGVYAVLPGETDAALLTELVNHFDAQATAAGLTTQSAQALGLTPYEVITLASVVEKEGYYTKNMPDVARVIYNRLANNMALQMDSTILYSLGQDGGTVTPQDLKIPSSYNTYLDKGLPPTPICTPSSTALTSAVHPPPGSWLFFTLVDKNGTEAFADTFTQQLANERLAQTNGVG